jgi:hypothetical protein
MENRNSESSSKLNKDKSILLKHSFTHKPERIAFRKMLTAVWIENIARIRSRITGTRLILIGLASVLCCF